MKFKKIVCLLTAVTLLLMLSGCGGVTLKLDEPYYVKMTFPEDMHIFTLSGLDAEDSLLEQYSLDYDELAAFRDDDGGIYYAKSNDLKRECTFASAANSTTKDIWELDGSDSETIKSVYKEIASNFTTQYYTVSDKDDFDQGSAHLIYIELMSPGSEKVDTIFITTVKNGQQFSMTYRSDEMDEAAIKQASKIYESIYFTKTIKSGSGETNNKAKLALIILGLLIAAAIAAMIIADVRRKNAEKDTGHYVTQFSDNPDSVNKPKKHGGEKR